MRLYYQPKGYWFGDCMPFGKGDTFYLFHQRDTRKPCPFGEPFGWDLATTKDFVTYEDCGTAILRGDDTKQDQFIFAGSVQIFNIGRRREVFADPVLPKGGSVDKVEGTAFEFYIETVSASALENRSARHHIYRTCRGEIACGLEYVAFLAVINGYQFHVVKRKFTEVHRPVLGIADLYAVVEYPHVLAAHTTDVDGFQTPDTSVVLYLHTGKIAQRIRYGM